MMTDDDVFCGAYWSSPPHRRPQSAKTFHTTKIKMQETIRAAVKSQQPSTMTNKHKKKAEASANIISKYKGSRHVRLPYAFSDITSYGLRKHDPVNHYQSW